MRNTVKDFMKRWKESREQRRRFTAALLVLSLLVTSGVSWQLRLRGEALAETAGTEAAGNATSSDAKAETAEHTAANAKSGTAGTGNAGTGTTETESNETSTTGTETAETGTTGTGAALEASPSDATPSDATPSNATPSDAEEHADWEPLMPELTGDWQEDLPAVAQSQVGYWESRLNYITDENGEKKGFTRYGNWYGDPYGDWSAMFAAWCLDYVGITTETVPTDQNCAKWAELLDQEGLYLSADSAAAIRKAAAQNGETAALPRRGDLIFLDTDADGQADRVGILDDVQEKELVAVAADVSESQTAESDTVAEVRYDPDDAAILGYGLLPAAASASLLSEETGLDGTGDITSAVLYHKKPSETDWIEADTSTEITGEEELKLEAEFTGIDLQELEDSGCVLRFALPEIMRDVQAGGSLVDAQTGEVIGTVSADESSVIITVYESWVDEKKASSNTWSGGFTITGKINYQAADENTDGTWKYGNVDIQASFEDDILAKYADIDIKKEVQEAFVKDDEGNRYIGYTLTVQAGQDGMPGVVVKDQLTENAYLTGYAEIGEKAVLSGAAGGYAPWEEITEGDNAPNGQGTIEKTEEGTYAFTWTIGDMGPNEKRVLTYYVQVKDGYLGSESTGYIANTAEVYSKNGKIKRAEDTATTPASGSASLGKSAEYIQEASDGHGYVITYRLRIKADASNKFTLKDLNLSDGISSYTIGGESQAIDSSQFGLVEGSVTYYEGDYLEGTLDSSSKLGSEQAAALFTMTAADSGASNLFDLKLASLEPGETYTVVYKVKVSGDVMAAMGSSTAELKNQVSMSPDGMEDLSWTAEATETMEPNTWTRKLSPETVTESEGRTISTAAEEGIETVYKDLTGGTVADSEDPATFTVSYGSAKYNVLVNEDGKWELSSATFTDTLQEDKDVVYAGWMKVSVYDIDDASASSSLTDQAAVDAVKAKTADKIIWVKVDNLSTFSFDPASLGDTEASQHTYLLEYYVKIKEGSTKNNIVFTNNFILTDPGNTILGRTVVTATSTVYQSSSVNPTKAAWYYAANATNADGEAISNGLLYWVIEIPAPADGILRAGVSVLDFPVTVTNGWYTGSWTGNTENYVYDLWLYQGMSGQAFTSGETVETIQQDSGLTLLGTVINDEKGSYEEYGGLDSITIETENNGTLTLATHRRNGSGVTVNSDYTLGSGNSLYMVVASRPSNNPVSSGRTVGTFQNSVKVRMSASEEAGTRATATQVVYGGETLFKEPSAVFTNTGGKKKLVNNFGGDVNISEEWNTSNQIYLDNLTESGTYVAWVVNVNYDGLLSGDYVFEDTIPEGLELVHVRAKYFGSNQKNPRPASTDLAANGVCPSEEWTEGSVTWKVNRSDTTQYTTVYYVNNDDPQRVRWGVTGLMGAQTQTTESYSIDYQIVCRVTDESLLLGGDEGKDFTNKVTLYEEDGTTSLSSDTSTINVEKKTLEKGLNSTKNDNDEYTSLTINYSITVNELAEDLVAGSDEITVVDEMSSNLQLYGNITVTDANGDYLKDSDGNEITSYPYTSETDDSGQTVLRITVPDGQKLTISYQVRVVKVQPGAAVTIENTAHWEGYSPGNAGTSKDENAVFPASAYIKEGTPVFTVEKEDGSNNSDKLPGAEFTLEKLGTFEASDDGTEIIYTSLAAAETISSDITTGDDGTVTIGTSPTLEWNTLYRLTETAAPSGYIGDSTPKYLVVFKQLETAGSSSNGYEDLWSITGLPDELKNLTGEEREANVFYDYTNTLSVTVTNYPSEVTLNLEKRDLVYSNNQEKPGTEKLSGAEFVLYRETTSGSMEYAKTVSEGTDAGKVVLGDSSSWTEDINNAYRFTSGSDGRFTITLTGVTAGTTYYLKEVKAPDGYQLSEDPVSITFDTTGKPSLLKADRSSVNVSGSYYLILNEPGYELPETGGRGALPYTLMGLLMAGGSLACLPGRKKKERYQ